VVNNPAVTSGGEARDYLTLRQFEIHPFQPYFFSKTKLFTPASRLFAPKSRLLNLFAGNYYSHMLRTAQ
jgi:hypothetical protein